jgi:acyl carrier protein
LDRFGVSVHDADALRILCQFSTLACEEVQGAKRKSAKGPRKISGRKSLPHANSEINRRKQLMDSPNIAERVLKIIAGALVDVPVHDIAMSESLVDDLGMDSLDVADLVVQIEIEFDIEIPYGEADGVKTVRDVVDSVKRYVAAKAK